MRTKTVADVIAEALIASNAKDDMAAVEYKLGANVFVNYLPDMTGLGIAVYLNSPGTGVKSMVGHSMQNYSIPIRIHHTSYQLAQAEAFRIQSYLNGKSFSDKDQQLQIASIQEDGDPFFLQFNSDGRAVFSYNVSVSCFYPNNNQ